MKNTSFVLSLMLILLISACNKVDQKTISSSEATTLVSEAAVAYSIYASTQEEGTRAGLIKENSMLSAKSASDEYPLITITPLDLTTWPKTITVDFGLENITGVDNHQRRGKMIITASNFPDVLGAEWEINFEDFYHDNYKVEGTQTITYSGPNASQHPVYQCTVSDGVITSPEEKVIHFEQQTQREWISGYDTHSVITGEVADLCDDEYQITGTHSGKSSDGYTYSMSTTEPLIVGVCCQWIKKGILYIGLDDYDLSCEIDYQPSSDTGDDCNNMASITIFGVTSTITLP